MLHALIIDKWQHQQKRQQILYTPVDARTHPKGLADLQRQVSSMDMRDRAAVEAERNHASAEVGAVKRGLEDEEARARAAVAELGRRLARSLAESTASVLINTEKLAKRHDKLSKAMSAETKRRQEETALLRSDLDSTAAALAKHGNEILLESRHAFATCEQRIGSVEQALTAKEETDLTGVERAIERNQVGDYPGPFAS